MDLSWFQRFFVFFSTIGEDESPSDDHSYHFPNGCLNRPTNSEGKTKCKTQRNGKKNPQCVASTLSSLALRKTKYSRYIPSAISCSHGVPVDGTKIIGRGPNLQVSSCAVTKTFVVFCIWDEPLANDF